MKGRSLDNMAAAVVIVVAAIITLWLLLGCETVTSEDGTVTQRVDTRAIYEGLEAGQGAYRFYRDQQQPAYQQRIYPQYQPTYYP